jgi:pimeloyl-ACP methyl ester carboxylesterase
MLQAARLPGPYILVAHSLGTLDARVFMARHPDRVAALILLDPSENARAIAEAVALDPRAGVAPMVAGAVACAEALSVGDATRGPGHDDKRLRL